MNTAAIARYTGRGPHACTAGPAAASPAGFASVTTVNSAVITFGRSAAGVRTVITPIIGAFTNGRKRPNTNSVAATPSHGRCATSTQSGIADAKIATPAVLSSGSRCTTRYEATLPAS